MRKQQFPRAQWDFRHCTVKHLKKAVWATALFDSFTKGKAKNAAMQN